MKTNLLTAGSFGVMLALLPLTGGCNSQATETSPDILAPNTVPDIIGFPATNDVAESASAPDEVSEVPTPPPEIPSQTTPPDMELSAPVMEVVKLADAGVSEAVMLSFVNNSASGFSLDSEQIVYLNDIGVPDSVVNAMMQRDQALKAAGYTIPVATPAPAPPPSETEETNIATEETPVVTEPGPTIVDDSYFYNTLSPYGSWVAVDGYGWCWQPTVVVVNPGWQPYCDRGRWIYTDCGWYWHSEYTWGSVAFHYGRWFNDPHYGWCWRPDRTWGPAWVSWRYDNNYCGWAPLSPAAQFNFSVGLSFGSGYCAPSAGCYTFVAWNNFCDPHPWRHCVPRDRCVAVYNGTRQLNNIEAQGHRRVFNGGVAPEHVAALTHREVPRYTVRERNGWAGNGRHGGRVDHVNRTVFESRPPIHESNFAPGTGNRTQFESRHNGQAGLFTPSAGNRTQFDSRPNGQEGLFTPPPPSGSQTRKGTTWNQNHWRPNGGNQTQGRQNGVQHHDSRMQGDRNTTVASAQSETAANTAPAPQPPQSAPVTVIGNRPNTSWQGRSRVSQSPSAPVPPVAPRTFAPQRQNNERRNDRSAAPAPASAPTPPSGPRQGNVAPRPPSPPPQQQAAPAPPQQQQQQQASPGNRGGGHRGRGNNDRN